MTEEENIENKKESDSVIEFDKSGFQDYFKEIQSQIKDKVITKLLTQLNSVSKENETLKEENKMLKNHLSYILKRIIINKSEYGTMCAPSSSTGAGNYGRNASSSSMRKIMNNSVILKDHKNLNGSGAMLRPLKSVENYRTLNANGSNFRCCTEGNIFSSSNNNDGYNHTKKKDKNLNYMDNKVNSYINSLYRNNFSNNNNGLSNEFFLNKKESLFDELFSNDNKKKLNDSSVNNERGGRNLSVNNSQRRLNSSVGKKGSVTKKGNKGSGKYNNNTNNNAKNKNIIRINKRENIGNNSKYLDNSYSDKKGKNTITNPNRGSKTSTNNNANKNKKPYISSKRSPFLANKW